MVGFLPYIFVFVASLYLPSDPDLGWHLKYGEYFFEHGQILRENIYSTMMAGYNWPNGSWGTDIITYAIYNAGGFLALTLAGAAIVTATFFFFSKAAKLTLLEEALFFPLLVYLQGPLNSYSFRGQLVSMLLLGVLFFILSKYKASSKILWSVPVLFFFWVNLQTESFLGLAVFVLWAILVMGKSYLKEKKFFTKENRLLLKVLIASYLVTFLNPFGWGIHQAALAHIGDPALKKIVEYIPFDKFTQRWWNQVGALIILLVAGIFLFYKKKLREYFPVLMLPLVLLLLSFDIRRYAWPAFYVALPFLHVLWQIIEKYVRKYAFYGAYIIVLISIGWVIYQKMPFNQFAQMTWRYYCEINRLLCSPDSAQFLIDNKLTKNVFSIYDWGGYLIWNYPEIKPTIDGRMHMWKAKNGYRPYDEYDAYMHATKKIDESPYDVVYFRMDETVALYTELKELSRKNKWRLIYNDGWAGIAIRVKE
jgi:hypothetical protein